MVPETSRVIDLRDAEPPVATLVGGKAAGLGALSRMDGVRVPPGFCVTTRAYRETLAATRLIAEQIDALVNTAPGDAGTIRTLSAEIRRAIEAAVVPAAVAGAVTTALAGLDAHALFAVRSSATAEDLPGASFAGQMDTYLSVAPEAVLEHVRRCWASLFSERAVTYRMRNGIDQRAVRMAVVVQQMVPAQFSGVLFTADPVTSNRTVSRIEAVPGLGEELVSGRVTPAAITVREGIVLDNPARLLTDDQALRLAELGRRIEARAGCPQDIEWCLDDDGFAVVQSRPITTLFPIPAAAGDERHVYVSVGHQQMMTDAMRPLGVSFWQLTAARPMFEAGGRMFVDVTKELSAPESRARLVEGFVRADPLTGDALRTVAERDFIPLRTDAAPVPPPPGTGPPPQIETDPAVVTRLIERCQESLAALERDIETKTGPELIDFILADIQDLKRVTFDPLSYQAILASMDAARRLNENLEMWLGEKNAADTFAESAPHNVTSEMGLALLDVADAIRPHAEVVAFLRGADDDGFLSTLSTLPGGDAARRALDTFLETYGMRCPGEIDITKPRWREQPRALLPMILGNIRNFPAGEAARRRERGHRNATAKADAVRAALLALPGGEQKAAETDQLIERLRTFAGYREYPKYHIVSRYAVYKKALLGEAERLVAAGILHAQDDIFYLSVGEVHDVLRARRTDQALIRRRRADFAAHERLAPPRVLTSEGEVVTGSYRRSDLPPGALAGLAVSAGTAEGRARVVRDIGAAVLEPGDILVTTFTDPSWTPLFIAVSALVTEVGGLMTHGAVIAREYGLPAVVAVEGATTRIPDGAWIRVDGTHGYVEVVR